MRRIGLAVVLALSLALSLPVAEAQQAPGKIPRLGYLSLRSRPTNVDEAFRQGLRDLGYVEGQNIVVEYRWADWKSDRLPGLATELVRLKVDIIVSTPGSLPALAAKKATGTIPIVFTAGDPVGVGLVATETVPHDGARRDGAAGTMDCMGATLYDSVPSPSRQNAFAAGGSIRLPVRRALRS